MIIVADSASSALCLSTAFIGVSGFFPTGSLAQLEHVYHQIIQRPYIMQLLIPQMIGIELDIYAQVAPQ